MHIQVPLMRMLSEALAVFTMITDTSCTISLLVTLCLYRRYTIPKQIKISPWMHGKREPYNKGTLYYRTGPCGKTQRPIIDFFSMLILKEVNLQVKRQTSLVRGGYRGSHIPDSRFFRGLLGLLPHSRFFRAFLDPPKFQI